VKRENGEQQKKNSRNQKNPLLGFPTTWAKSLSRKEVRKEVGKDLNKQARGGLFLRAGGYNLPKDGDRDPGKVPETTVREREKNTGSRDKGELQEG